MEELLALTLNECQHPASDVWRRLAAVKLDLARENVARLTGLLVSAG